MSKRHDAASRRRILVRWRRSGLSGQAFARRAGLSFATLYRWRRELGPGGRGKFIELVAHDAARQKRVEPVELDPTLEIALPAGICVRVRCGVDEELLRLVVRTLL